MGKEPMDEEFTNDRFEEAEEMRYEAINDVDTECQFHHLEIELGSLVEKAWEQWQEEHKAEMCLFRTHHLEDSMEEMFYGAVYGMFRRWTKFHCEELEVYEG